jgi:hypothetical protein
LRVRVTSDNPNVHPNDITLKVESRKYSADLPINNNGFISFDVDKNLIGKNAFLVSNQPKGTIITQFVMVIKKKLSLQNGSIRYKELVTPLLAGKRAVDQVNTITEEVEEVLESIDYMKMTSITLHLENSDRKPVVITAEENIRIIPDQKGNVIIPFRQDLLRQNPLVFFPSKNVMYITPFESR